MTDNSTLYLRYNLVLSKVWDGIKGVLIIKFFAILSWISAKIRFSSRTEYIKNSFSQCMISNWSKPSPSIYVTGCYRLFQNHYWNITYLVKVKLTTSITLLQLSYRLNYANVSATCTNTNLGIILGIQQLLFFRVVWKL